jgi:hypothetical protein
VHASRATGCSVGRDAALAVEARATYEDVYESGVLLLAIPSLVRCDECRPAHARNGTAATAEEEEEEEESCTLCGDRGFVASSVVHANGDWAYDEATCVACQRGAARECATCDGRGFTMLKRAGAQVNGAYAASLLAVPLDMDKGDRHQVVLPVNAAVLDARPQPLCATDARGLIPAERGDMVLSIAVTLVPGRGASWGRPAPLRRFSFVNEEDPVYDSHGYDLCVFVPATADGTARYALPHRPHHAANGSGGHAGGTCETPPGWTTGREPVRVRGKGFVIPCKSTKRVACGAPCCARATREPERGDLLVFPVALAEHRE